MVSPNVPSSGRPEPVSNADQQAVANERLRRLAGVMGPPTNGAPAAPPPVARRAIPGTPTIGLIAQEVDAEGNVALEVKGFELTHSLVMIVENRQGSLTAVVIPKPAG